VITSRRARLTWGAKLEGDHEVVRDCVKSLLLAEGGMLIVAEAATVREAVASADRSFPDVIVVDVRLADGSGIKATRYQGVLLAVRGTEA
jgi:DNA-binding NarL/FixJ family response regulator